jgi:anaerobic magnesium-protoporphyrin IX monomethyl ester cyclase
MKPHVLLVVLPYVVTDIDATRPKIRSYLAHPYGPLSIVTYNRNLADFKILDLNLSDNPIVPLMAAIHEFKPDIVGFSLMFDSSYKYLGDCLEVVKNINKNIVTLLGGAAASYAFEEILAEQPDLDAICYSEGELAMSHMLSYTYFNIWNLTGKFWITRNSLSRGVTPEIAFIQNLDDVIDIDYSFIDPDDYGMAEAFSPYAREKSKQFFISTSRGCFGKCSFCSNGALHGRKVRQASVDRIIAHVKHLVDDYGMETLTFYDDCLLFNKERAKDLFRKLAQFKIRVEGPNGLNVAFIDEEMAVLMKEAGMDTAYLAVESGSEYVLTHLIHKPLKLHMVKPVVKALQAQGIFCHGFFVCGMPGETDVHRQETADFIRDIDLNWSGLNLATPLRGSPLYEECIKNGWIKKQKIGEVIDKKYVIKMPGIDPEEVTRQVNDMNIQLNFHENHAMRHGDYATAAACFRQVLERYSGHHWARYYIKICEEKLAENKS